MKKPALIVVCILGALVIAVAVAVIVDMSQRNKNSNPATQPVVQDPLQPQPAVQQPIPRQPVAQLQNLQAPMPAAGDARVAGLIRSLSDPNINASIQAEKELLLIGKPALPQLEQAATTLPDAATRETCKRLVAQISSGVGVPAVAAGGDNGLGALQGMLGNAGGAGGGDMNALLGQMLGGAQGGNNNGAQMQALQQMLGGMGGGGGLGALGGGGGRRGGMGGLGGGGMGQMLQGLMAMQNRGGGQGGNGQMGGMDMNQMMALLGRMGGGRGGHGFNVPNPQDAGVGDLSTNLMDSFGARLSEAADGVRVLDLKQGTSASAAGLRVGDLITQMNGRQIAKGEDVREIFGNLAAGDKIEMEVTRRGDAVTLAAKK